MFTRIYDRLKETGFDVYAIGQHKGLCNAPYVVVKENSTRNASHSLSGGIVDIIVFYPLGRYSDVRPFMDSVIAALEPLGQQVTLKSTGEITPIIIDDSVKAYTCSIKYQHFKRRVV